MPFIKTSKNKDEGINLYYETYGEGKNVVFIHGWPLSGSMWEYQVTDLSVNGYKCICYDRRGFGKSDKPADGYDYNTMSDDLKAVLDELDLQEVTLVGFSMGGGEIAKYFSNHGGARVCKVVIISAVIPYMLKTPDNPDGVPQETFDEMTKNMKADRPGFLADFAKDFFGVKLLKHPVSDAFLANNLTKTMEASAIATLECAKAFATTDFRNDVPAINVPALIIHGDSDVTVPIEPTGKHTAKMLPDAIFKIYEGAPHGLWFTEKEKLNADLKAFI